jgi:predicted enzyme related to lactoylglutathione lyase
MEHPKPARDHAVSRAAIQRERLFMGAPVVHFEIMGGEGNELESFYSELLGWKINSNNPMKYGIVDTGGGPGGIDGGVGPANDGGKRVSIYAQVTDLQATLDRVEKLGGKTILPPTEVPGGPKLAMFADPAGNVTGLLLAKKANQ